MQEIAGNQVMQKMLSRAVENEHLHHALMFHGPSGIGRFLLALNLVRILNCRENPLKGCGECHSCRRIQMPFPFHPDLRIFRDIEAPVVISRNILLERYQREIAGAKCSGFLDHYQELLETLKSNGHIKEHHLRGSQTVHMDVIYLNPSKPLTPKSTESIPDNPESSWFLKKLLTYQENSCFQKSIKIKAIRNLQKELNFHPFEGKYKAAIIDDADKMLIPAQNSLLKTLEEPSGKALIILIVTNPSSLLATIRSRCQLVPFFPLKVSEMQELLTGQFEFDPQDAAPMSRWSEGRVSKALQTDWDAFQAKEENYSTLFDGRTEESQNTWVIRVVDTILNQNPSEYGESPVSDFYRWLHYNLKAAVARGDDHMDVCLPGGSPMPVFHGVQILEGLTRINNIKVFHPDLRLQLESLFFNLAGTDKGFGTRSL